MELHFYNMSICKSVEQIFENSINNVSHRKRLQFNDERLNDFFENGILNQSVIEIVGNCGTGKTQFLLTLCADILIEEYEKKIKKKEKKQEPFHKISHDNNKKKKTQIIKEKQRKIFYIFVHGAFNFQRLETIIRNKLKKRPWLYEEVKQRNKNNTQNYLFEECYKNIIENLFCYRICDSLDFFYFFKYTFPRYLEKHYITLLIIDQINSICVQPEDSNIFQGYHIHAKMSLVLKQIICDHKLFILLTNCTFRKEEFPSFSLDLPEQSLSSSFYSNTVIQFKKKIINNVITRKAIVKNSEFISQFKTLDFEITDAGFEVI